MAGLPIDLVVAGDRHEFPEEDFFGFGIDSLDSDRTSYLLKSTGVGADLQVHPHRALTIAGGLWQLDERTGAGADPRYPSLEQMFGGTAVPAFGTDTTFRRASAGAVLDLRDNALHPHSGSQYEVRVARYQDRGARTFDFDRVELDMQHYVPLPNRYRTLALRAAGVFTDPNRGDQVPFYYQPTLGGSQALRGFREFRFRDLNSVVVQAEYRWEAWWALDGALFVDVGQVAPTRSELTLRDMQTSYGIGFRLHSNRAFVARLDLAYSREGFLPLLRFEHVF
jgi:outer membrane protein assembly factor BamA